ncbi:cation channel family protein [Stylonychia lemnae]|uniref:Cation channel family protein n=1 Tax=Stylonychia lemnae TaxID=5949 RepID=A0A078B6M7_STYLE|nr:cation channel family protein [Stylonychia lemnae]|eukprot:CDW88937.1 cation channel family protein [Stylonychia lemnae]
MKNILEGGSLPYGNDETCLWHKRIIPLFEIQKGYPQNKAVNIYLLIIYRFIVTLSGRIISSQIFEYFYLVVIICNSIVLALDDPTQITNSTYRDNLDNFFSALYFFEFFLKIFGMGFVFNKGAYLRDYWNIIDFLVVIQLTLQVLIETGLKLQVLRAFRVLRPLRTITSIEGLKLLVSALIAALPLLRDTIIILIFFFLVFGIGALQVLSGDLENRCFDLETGLSHHNDLICGRTTICPPGYICGQRLQNPNLGVTNFDNILFSLLTIFQCTTLESWSVVMLYVMKSTHYLLFLVFIPLVFIGAYFLLNLTLAVINFKFTEAHKFFIEKKKLETIRKMRNTFMDNLNIQNLRLQNENNLLDDTEFIDELGETRINRFEIGLSFLRNAQFKKKQERKKKLIYIITTKICCLKCKKNRKNRYKIEQNTSINPLISNHDKKGKDQDSNKQESQKIRYLLDQYQIDQMQQEILKKTKFKTKDFSNLIPLKVMKFNDQLLKTYLRGNRGKISHAKIKDSRAQITNTNILQRIPSYQQQAFEQNEEFKINFYTGLIDEPLPNKKDFSKIIFEESSQFSMIDKQENNEEQSEEIKENFRRSEDSKQEFLSQVSFESNIEIQQMRKTKVTSPQKFQNLSSGTVTSGLVSIDENYPPIDIEERIFQIRQKQTFQEDRRSTRVFENLILSNHLLMQKVILKVQTLINLTLTVQLDKAKIQLKLEMQSIHQINNKRRFIEDDIRSIRKQDKKISLSLSNIPSKQTLPPLKRKNTGIIIRKLVSSNKIGQITSEDSQELFLDNSKKKSRSRFKQQQKFDLAMLVGDKTASQPKFHLSQLINQKQKIIINDKKPEYFSSSQINVYEKRIQHFSKIPKIDINKREENEDDDFPDSNRYRPGIARPKCKPYQMRVMYQINEDKLHNEIMTRLVEREEFRHLEEQPYQMLSQYGKNGTYNMNLIQRATKISDLYITSTLSFTLIPSRKNVYLKDQVNINQARLSEQQEQNLVPGLGQKLLSIQDNLELVQSASSFQSGSSISGGEEKFEDDQIDIQSENNQEKEDQKHGKLEKEKSQQDSFDNEKYEDDQLDNTKQRLTFSNKERVKSTKNVIQADNYKFVENNSSKIQELGDENFQRHLSSPRLTIHKSYMPKVQDNIFKTQQQFDINYNSLQINNARHARHGSIQKSSTMHVNFLEVPKNFGSQNRIRKIQSNELILIKQQKSNQTKGDSPTKIKELLNKAIEINVQTKQRRSSISNSKDQHIAQLLPRVKSIRRKQNTLKDYERKKEKLDKINLENVHDFFQGNFYSSDEDKQENEFERQNLQYQITQGKIALNKDNLDKLNALNNDQELLECSIKKVIQTSKIGRIKKSKGKDDIQDDLSDVPTSLYSDYEELKYQRQRIIRDGQKSRKFADLINTLQSQTHSNYFDYLVMRRIDLQKKKIISRWSGQDVLMNSMNDYKALYITSKLNGIRVWPQAWGFLKQFKNSIKTMVKSPIFENFMLLCVLINTVILAFDRYDIDPELDLICTIFNLSFTFIFCIELLLKISGLGVTKYFKDLMNYLDSAVVLISIVEITLNQNQLTIQGKPNTSGRVSQGSLSAFKVVRIFRTFRVLRVARLLRQLRSMQIIIGVIQRSIKSFIYIALLLFLFLYIYSLLGMTLFGDMVKYDVGIGLSNGNEGPLSRANFQDFHNAFMTVFQLLTMENWSYILYDTLYYSDLNQVVIIIYFVSWIFIGNFILLNLFLAILLDSFLVEEEEEDEICKQEEEKLKQFERKNKKSNKIKKQHKDISKFFAMNTLRRKSEKPLNDLISMLKIKGKQNYNQQQQQISINLAPSQIQILKQQEAEELKYFEELDFEDRMKLIIKNGISQNQKRLRKNNIRDNFKDIDCQNSLYLFSKTNKVRLILSRIVKHNYFEKFILVIIVTSSIKLAVDTYYLEDYKNQRFLENLDILFTGAFLIESVIKIISFGFIIDRGSYLRESWNILDFFIVFTSLLDLALVNITIPSIKILRLLRTIRPLRFITHNSAMKVLVVALLESVGSIINVIIVVVVAWLMFAILGVSFFSGKFYYCTQNKYQNITEAECIKDNGEWIRYDSNFDDVIRAMLTLFVVSSLENWNDVLYQAVDCTNPGQGPKLNNFQPYSYYFVLFILIGTYFFLNFFIGVLFLNFKLAKKKMHVQEQIMKQQDPNEVKSQIDEKLQQQYTMWKDIQILIINAQPDYETTNIPKQKWRKLFHSFVSSNAFDIFIMISILLNMIQLACYHEGASSEYLKVLDDINILFTVIFIIEATLKLIGYGLSYFRNAQNVFDFIIVLSSISEIMIDNLQNNSGRIISLTPQIIRVLRVLRVTRIVRLIGKYQGLQALVSTIMFSLPPLLNVFSLLMIIFFIFSVLGVFLFNQVEKGNSIDGEYKNFKNFGLAMLTLFRISTGEDWNNVMYDTMNPKNCAFKTDCVSSFAPIYFISFVLICSYVMLNLFVLIILQQFDKYYLPKDNVISKFKKDLLTFKEAWKRYTMERYNCQVIRDAQIIQFMRNLRDPLGMSSTIDQMELQKDLVKLGIRTEDGYVYFNEMLYRCMRRVYGNVKLDCEMQINELRTQIKIQKEIMIKQSNSFGFFQKSFEKEAIYGIMQKNKLYNPFVQNFYAKMAFGQWFQLVVLKREQSYTDFEEELNNRERIEIEYETDEDVCFTDEDDITEDRIPSMDQTQTHNGSELKLQPKNYIPINRDFDSAIVNRPSIKKQKTQINIGEKPSSTEEKQRRASRPKKSVTLIDPLELESNINQISLRLQNTQDSKENSIKSRNDSEIDQFYVIKSPNDNKKITLPPIKDHKQKAGENLSLTAINNYKKFQSFKNQTNVEIIQEEEEPQSATFNQLEL